MLYLSACAVEILGISGLAGVFKINPMIQKGVSIETIRTKHFIVIEFASFVIIANNTRFKNSSSSRNSVFCAAYQRALIFFPNNGVN